MQIVNLVVHKISNDHISINFTLGQDMVVLSSVSIQYVLQVLTANVVIKVITKVTLIKASLVRVVSSSYHIMWFPILNGAPTSIRVATLASPNSTPLRIACTILSVAEVVTGHRS